MKSVPLAALFLVGASSLATADMPGPDWMTKDAVVKTLEGLGFTDVRKLEADDGHWEGDATKAGRRHEIHVDPHTGALTKDEPKD